MSIPHAERRGARATRGVALGVAAMLVSGAVGFAAGQIQATGRVTQLTIAPCGLDAAPAPVALPLDDLLRKAGGHGVSLGPFRHDGLDRAVTVRFALDADGPVRHRDAEGHDLLVLPVTVSGTALPDEIRLECRFGTVARVQYRTGRTREARDITPDPDRVDPTAG